MLRHIDSETRLEVELSSFKSFSRDVVLVKLERQPCDIARPQAIGPIRKFELTSYVNEDKMQNRMLDRLTA